MDVGSVRSRATPWFVFFTVVAALYFGRSVLTPIALAAFIAFLLAPAVRALHRVGVPKALGASLTLGGLAILFLAIGWLLLGQVGAFAERLPEYASNLQAKIEAFWQTYGGTWSRASSTVRALNGELSGTEAAPAAAAPPASDTATALELAQGLIGSLTVFAGLTAFVFVLSWIMLLRADDLRDRGLELAGRSELYVTTRAASEASIKVTRYVRKQLLVNVMHGTVLGLLLAWIGVPSPLVWGILAAGLRFIPYLGPAISTCAPIVVAFATMEGFAPTWKTAGALLGLELVTNNIVEPLVYGRATGISTLAIFVAAAFWTWVWGPIGLVLSTPLTVCLLVVGKHFPRLRFLEVLIGDQPPMPEGTRLYHRMLAGDQDGAWDLLRTHAKTSSVLVATDEVLVPALGLAGQAVREGSIEPGRREKIATLAHALVAELEDARRTEETPTLGHGLRVRCLTARDEFDAIGTRLFAGELERRGAQVTATGEDVLLAESLERIQEDPPQVVCVSSVAPTHYLQVRALCKRLLQLDEEVQIVLGLWGEDLEHAELEQRLPASPRIHVATRVVDAVELVVASPAAAEARLSPEAPALSTAP